MKDGEKSAMRPMADGGKQERMRERCMNAGRNAHEAVSEDERDAGCKRKTQ